MEKPRTAYSEQDWNNRMTTYQNEIINIVIPRSVSPTVAETLLADIDLIHTYATVELSNFESQYSYINDLITIKEKENFERIKNNTLDAAGKTRKLNNDETESLVIRSIIEDAKAAGERDPYLLRINYKIRMDFLKQIVFLCKSKIERINLILQSQKITNYISPSSRGGYDNI